jgi:hypothetical protein
MIVRGCLTVLRPKRLWANQVSTASAELVALNFLIQGINFFELD